MQTIGERIKARREQLQLSQDELAKKLGYKSRSSINKIEMDSRNLTQSKIKAIADALETTPSYIMGWEEIERYSNAFAGMVSLLKEIYEFVEEKSIMSDTGWTQTYWLVGKAPNTFVLYEPDIDTLVESTKAFIPALVARMKDIRPEADIVQEILTELNQIEAPEQ